MTDELIAKRDDLVKELQRTDLEAFYQLIDSGRLHGTLMDLPSQIRVLEEELERVNDNWIIDYVLRQLDELTGDQQPLSTTTLPQNLFNEDETHKRMNIQPMQTRKRVIPDWDDSISTLTQLRNDAFQRMEGKVKQIDLGKALEDRKKFADIMSQIRVPKEKKQKHGKVQPAMKDLVDIVLNLKQDVRQIREAQSLESAKDWIKRHNYQSIYNVKETDLNNDGIVDVVVHDTNGNPVIVNGYTTVDSKFPYRQEYYKRYPTPFDREQATAKGIRGPRDIVNEIYGAKYDEFGRNIVEYNRDAWNEFEDKIRKAGYKTSMVPHKRSTFQAFVKYCITPIYRAIQYIANNKAILVKGKKLDLTQLASTIWNQSVLIPAMKAVYGPNVGKVTDEEWATLRGKKAVKEAIDIIVEKYLTNHIEALDMVTPALEYMNAKMEGNVPGAFIPLVKAATDVIFVEGESALPRPFPGYNEFYEWYTKMLVPSRTISE